MRNLFLVCYDISDDKRWRKVFTTMRGFGDTLQYSVFICELSPKERALLKNALDGIIHHTEDRVVIANLGPAEGGSMDRIEFLGQRLTITGRQAVIV
ncbi:MAG: CRISPR-associated endonuclease Cas2 [Candidatus Thermoplasmatota archaeon]